jgi:glycosyltransferase involved in cell wall biosynthesis
VPNHNGSATIGRCLKALYASDYKNFEVIVVDDRSDDASVALIERFPCKLIRLPRRGGASRARNAGGHHSSGSILFFIDADCLVMKNTLQEVAAIMNSGGRDRIIGGTYTSKSYDNNFFSDFQSIFIHCAETKYPENPDYVATHAMAIDADTFKRSGGFKEDFLPILEDVEFSHRMRRAGLKLRMNRKILVQHIFNFTLLSSMRNGMKKSMYWSIYSFLNRDLFADSGTASLGLKANLASFLVTTILVILSLLSGQWFWLYLSAIPFLLNFLANKRLFTAFYDTNGLAFAFLASLYYMLLYPVAVGAGTTVGMFSMLRDYCVYRIFPHSKGRNSKTHGAGIDEATKPLLSRFVE